MGDDGEGSASKMSLAKQISKKKGGDQLSRDDFDAGPPSVDVIEPGLLLGNLTTALDLEMLELHGVNHVLTVDSVPLPRSVTEISYIKTKFIQVTDNEKEALILHFDDGVQFINQAMESGVVLVHCYYGVSRSATLVLAFLMKKYGIDFDEAMERLLQRRRFVQPNPGFEAQLRLYAEMGWQIDPKHTKYKYFRLSIASDKVRKAKILPQDCLDVVKPDPFLATLHPEPLVYRCRHCRRVIASASNVFPHHVASDSIGWQAKRVNSVRKKSSGSIQPVLPAETEGTGKTCNATLFVEPLAWMQPLISHQPQGKLLCPKCKVKLGAYSWVSGCQCPCGVKQSPAFYLVPSKLDWCTVVQNLQMTV
ncbi:dual specificity protein phosphatase MPK-4 [Neocloeon triangulifer]|uniref:dual specificity protein phosphatase MPK-4 n=1 Tax=Neocloeon triangulifer TaxID=2078957 RepID=UPI00286F8DDA|nr:dual specificity protein phosphatase MPK-4 [Neocloeon triangulifer]XP_059470273.1 dual specificity protein phosphatase MPK-4 [Neocloeon triangulifer]XP_059470282.1 dual specificity protein phosphatase MPK-4 [Neocloeon triangulifer]XP_059470291.1 dual specificity protein phosphatase MPK-4 [Neocloeon triangulifer]